MRVGKLRRGPVTYRDQVLFGARVSSLVSSNKGLQGSESEGEGKGPKGASGHIPPFQVSEATEAPFPEQ